jgi:excisionase family DNA binding protein
MTNERWDMREDVFSMQRDPGHNAAGLNGARSDNGIANREGVEAGKRGFAAAPSSDIHGQDVALLDVTEVAEYLRISRSSVYKLIERQQIPAIRIGRLLRVRKKDLDETLRAMGDNR